MGEEALKQKHRRIVRWNNYSDFFSFQQSHVAAALSQ